MNDYSPVCSTQIERHQFFEENVLLGFVDYYRFGNTVLLMHTESNPALPGKGHGSIVAERATTYFRSHHTHIVPVCSFFAHFLRTRPQHHDMVSIETRKLFEIGTDNLSD